MQITRNQKDPTVGRFPNEGVTYKETKNQGSGNRSLEDQALTTKTHIKGDLHAINGREGPRNSGGAQTQKGQDQKGPRESKKGQAQLIVPEQNTSKTDSKTSPRTVSSSEMNELEVSLTPMTESPQGSSIRMWKRKARDSLGSGKSLELVRTEGEEKRKKGRHSVGEHDPAYMELAGAVEQPRQQP